MQKISIFDYLPQNNVIEIKFDISNYSSQIYADIKEIPFIKNVFIGNKILELFCEFRDIEYQNFINLNNLMRIFKSQVDAIVYFQKEFDLSDQEIEDLILSTISNIVRFGNDSV